MFRQCLGGIVQCRPEGRAGQPSDLFDSRRRAERPPWCLMSMCSRNGMRVPHVICSRNLIPEGEGLVFGGEDEGLLDPVDVRVTADPDAVRRADLVVLPGTRSTVADLEWMRGRGLGEAVLSRVAAGRPVLGICGGYQMLAEDIDDPDG